MYFGRSARISLTSRHQGISEHSHCGGKAEPGRSKYERGQQLVWAQQSEEMTGGQDGEGWVCCQGPRAWTSSLRPDVGTHWTHAFCVWLGLLWVLIHIYCIETII